MTAHHPLLLTVVVLAAAGLPASRLHAVSPDSAAGWWSEPVICEGVYPLHLQGVCTDKRQTIFWSWTDVLVKTDQQGRLLAKVPVANHHGDLCIHDGKVYVAVNLGKFNQPAVKADSWIYVYDAADLREVARHRVSDVVHGAGGIAFQGGRFVVVGGLPEGTAENIVYEYSEDFVLLKRHHLASGHTLMGIQTAAHVEGSWWFGCYGKPQTLLRADKNLRLTGKWTFDASVGLEASPGGGFLTGRQEFKKGRGWTARIVTAKEDPAAGLKLVAQ